MISTRRSANPACRTCRSRVATLSPRNSAALPHKDPFDAILVAQAAVERLALLTADAKLLTAVPEAVDAGA